MEKVLKEKTESRRLILTASILILVNFLLRIAFAASNDLAMDEPFTVWWAQHSLGEITAMLGSENNPPLHFFLLHFWIKLFGISAFSVRLPSVIFSSITAGLIFMTAARQFSFKAGLMAALMYTLSVMHMSFSHEARVYPLFVMLAVWNLALMLRIIGGDTNKALKIWLFISGLLLVYSHYFGWIPLLMQWIFMMTYKNVRIQWKSFLLLWIVLFAAYLPVFWIFLQRFLHSSGGTWVPAPQWTELYGNINRFLNDRWVTAVILGIFLIGVIVVTAGRKLKETVGLMFRNRALTAVLLWFGFPYFIMFLVSFRLPVFLDRYILFTSAGLFILIAAVVDHIFSKRWMRYTAYMVPLFVMMFFFDLNPYNNRNISHIASLLKSIRPSGDKLIISPEYASLEFSYHYDIEAFRDYKQTNIRLRQQGVFPVRSLKVSSDSEPLKASRIFYLDCGSAFAFGEDQVLLELNEYYSASRIVYIDGVYTLRVFSERRPEDAQH